MDTLTSIPSGCPCIPGRSYAPCLDICLFLRIHRAKTDYHNGSFHIQLPGIFRFHSFTFLSLLLLFCLKMYVFFVYVVLCVCVPICVVWGVESLLFMKEIIQEYRIVLTFFLPGLNP